MKNKIYSVENSNDESIWYFKTKEQTININKLLNESVIEADYLDDAQKYISVMYSNWDSMELRAIIDTKGNVIYSGINTIEEYIQEHDLFIIELNSDYINAEAVTYFGLQTDTIYYTIIDSNGKLLIDFDTNYVSYEDGVFLVNDKEYTLRELSENL